MDLLKLKSGTDIRGVACEGVPGQSVNLTTEAVDKIARAFVLWLDKPGARIAVGRDCRITGPAIADTVMTAFRDMGADVLDCGLCTTPAMFMTTVLKDCDAAVSITASHHPFNRNGLKFFTKQGGLEGSDITDILTIASGEMTVPAQKGESISCAFLEEYAAYLRNMICESLHMGEQPLAGLKLVVDAGNGAGGFYATQVLEPLGADITGSVYLEPDGTFPNHIPNPENDQAMQSACKATLDAKADLGIIFDTDVDRAGAVGPDGAEINRNRLVALASALALADCPGGTIVTDSVTSSGLKTFIEETLGGEHYRYRRGYKNVIDEAIRLEVEEGKRCPLAIETSGHAAFKKNYFLDDGAYLITRIVIRLAELKAQGKAIEDLIAGLQEPAERKELRIDITVDDFKPCGMQVLDALEAYAKQQDGWRIADDNREGLRVFIDDGWFLLRLSVHDPVMPLNFESDSVGGVKTLIEAVYPFFATQKGIDLAPFAPYIQKN